MKLLLTGPVPPHPGGGAISRAQLASGFARAGHDVCVIAPITREALRDGDRFAAAHPELRVVRYVLNRFEQQPFRPPPGDFLREESGLVEPLVKELLESFRPDLVVVGRESFVRYVPKVVNAYGVPSVLLVRGSPTGHILRGQFPRDDAEQLLGEMRKVNKIIAVAKYLQEGLTTLRFRDVSYIPNAIDIDQFVRRPNSRHFLTSLGIDPQATVVLVPANLHQRKRPEDVVRSARLALQQRPDLVYLMAGVGVQRDEIERLCLEMGLSRAIRFLGWVDYERMPTLMNAADIVLMASESEGMARAYLEAMACERVLLASDIPSACEIVEDGVNGLLFRLGDVEHLAARTIEAAAAPARRAEIGRRARASVQHLSVERAVPLYLREFSETIAAAATLPSSRTR